MANKKTEKIQKLLTREKIWQKLLPYSPEIAGTFPLGIDVEDSDIDIICEIRKPADFSETMRQAFAGYPQFSVTVCKKYVVCNFKIEEFRVEIYGENRPVKEQNAWRHLQTEDRILKMAGKKFREQIIALKRSGVKTEPAFARILQLKGDPFEELLKLEQWSDRQLAARLKQNGWQTTEDEKTEAPEND